MNSERGRKIIMTTLHLCGYLHTEYRDEHLATIITSKLIFFQYNIYSGLFIFLINLINKLEFTEQDQNASPPKKLAFCDIDIKLAF